MKVSQAVANTPLKNETAGWQLLVAIAIKSARVNIH